MDEDIGRTRYIEKMRRSADFIDDLSALCQRHGIHIETDCKITGRLKMVENDPEAGAMPLLRLHWVGGEIGYEV